MDSKNTLVDKLLCMGCLCVGRSLQKITDDKMKQYYLDALNEIPDAILLLHKFLNFETEPSSKQFKYGEIIMSTQAALLSLCDLPQACPSICWECEALLNKAVSFREQVKDSYRILQSYTNDKLRECLLTDVSRPPRLGVRVGSPVDLPPVLPPAGPLDVALVCVKEELKIDWDDDTRDVDPMPPAELEDPVPDIPDEKIDIEIVKTEEKPVVRSKTKKAKKTEKQVEKILKLKKKAKTKRRPTEAESKIITIELSYEEMLAEREREATRESYLKAQYKCDSCLIAFNYSRSCQAHRANKHAPELGDYSCPICKTVIASVDSFTAHYKRHTRRYECSICRKRTQDMKVMQQHYYGVHAISLKQYHCNLCGKISNSIDTHRYHKDSHKARVQCPECDKSFSHRSGLMNHRVAVHELKNAFPCTVCEKVFRWKASLKRHMEKHHVKDKSAPAYCAACGVSFSSVCSYQRHMRNSLKHVSQDQLKFTCDHCGRRFADKTKLRDHIEEKHLHKTYQCHICHKSSKNRVGLDQHVRNVHRGRPNNKMCHHCGKGYPTKVQLESHIRTHTGERPFICEFCPTTFSQQSNLYKHNRQVHLNIKSKRYPLCKKKDDKTEPAEELPRPVAVLHYSPQRGFVM